MARVTMEVILDNVAAKFAEALATFDFELASRWFEAALLSIEEEAHAS